jgi:peptidyl-prolyl cis-trans isomerase C
MNKPLFPDITVNGQTIASPQIAAEAQNHAAPSGKPGIAWRKAARALVIRTLMLQRAARLGLSPQPQSLGDGLRETNDEALIRAAMEAGVVPAAPNPDAIRAVYDANPGQFRSPALYEVAHILFGAAPNDGAARQKARQLADNVQAALAKRPDDFDALAKAHSQCPSRDVGGHLGQIGPGDTVPEFEHALAGLQEGETTKTPVETRYGFHIIRLIARADGAILPFAAVRSHIGDALEKAAWARAAHDFTAGLVNAASISGINMDADLRGT